MVRTLLSFVTMWACRLANVVLCVSTSNRDFLVANRICPAEKISILCNGSSHGVDARARFNRTNANPARLAALRAKYGVKDNDVVYGFTGRIVKDKGIEDLFAAWKRFAAAGKNAHLFIVGHTEARGAVSAACLSGMAQEPSVHVVDDVNDPYEFYCLFDVFVFPSHREGMPNAVLEAAPWNCR